jgi:hypothetical protein
MNIFVLVDLCRRDHLSIRLNNFGFTEVLNHIWWTFSRIDFSFWFTDQLLWLKVHNLSFQQIWKTYSQTLIISFYGLGCAIFHNTRGIVVEPTHKTNFDSFLWSCLWFRAYVQRAIHCVEINSSLKCYFHDFTIPLTQISKNRTGCDNITLQTCTTHLIPFIYPYMMWINHS